MILRMRGFGLLVAVVLMAADCSSRAVDKTTKDKNPVLYGPWSKRDMRIAVVDTSRGDRLQKTTETFNGNSWVVNNGHSWIYSDWSSANQQDGFLCRSSSDCTWLDTDLECYKIQPKVKSDLWFGGDAEDIVGSCRCLDNFWWDGDDLLCQRWGMARYEGFPWWQILLIILAASVPVFCVVVCISSYFANLRAKREEAKRKEEEQRRTEEEQGVQLSAMECN